MLSIMSVLELPSVTQPLLMLDLVLLIATAHFLPNIQKESDCIKAVFNIRVSISCVFSLVIVSALQMQL